ncbi:putative transmembrane protein [Phytophthora cinnamomi]|uniref:putative transmembrane protein n=1 Tax=Phytophthora cinnamomi TaxID=4785 RepID=UPI00355A1099|nr:putative transmembrane protein [Phytophthora cinnamomi]
MTPHKLESRARSPSALEMAAGTTGMWENYIDMNSPTTPTTQSMRLRLRKQQSTASSSIANEETRGHKTVTRVKKTSRRPEERVFRRHIGCAARAAAGVLLAGVIQTGSSASSTGSRFLPSFYYLGGLAYAAIMVIYASAPTVGGVVQQIWQIDLGVGLALLYNFALFLCIPITQGNLVSVPENLNDTPYYVSLHDWGLVSPFMVAFTFVVFLLPIQHNIKKFAVMSNAFFMLKFIDPMNPRAGATGLKDLRNSDYDTLGLMKNLAVYSIVGVIGTLISLMTALLPTPLFATKKLMRHMDHAPHDIRKILNLIMDSYCFRVKDIKKMDFFRLRLDRLLRSAQHRLSEMEELLDDCWWEEMVGVGLCLTFNKNIAKQFVKLYARLLKDLRAMKFAIEAENGHWTHVVLMKRMQQSLHIMQTEANDLLQEISSKVLEASTDMPTPQFVRLEQTVDHFMKKYTKLYGAMLSAEVHTPGDVGKTMSLNVFIYSFHSFVHTLSDFEQRFNQKNFSCRYRICKFFHVMWCSVYQGTMYMRRMTMFAVRTTLAVLIAYCASTFVFAFSATGPTAIAMVAQFHVGGTYGNMKNRMAGLVAGTVVPSILHFFICKISDVVFYNAVNNAVLFTWIVGSILRLLSDLVEWQEKSSNHEGYQLKRRNAGSLNDECTAAFKEQEEQRANQPETVYYTAIAPKTEDVVPEEPLPPLPSNATPAVAKARWDRSQNAYESVVVESLESLVTLFSKDFTYKTADDYAIYLQMKEAFRIADKDRSGTVDTSELGVLLEKLMPYTGDQGNVHMDQYVDEFMRLVDKNHDGQITFAEFMQALNDGFRLELEIYESTTQMIASNPVHQLGNGDDHVPPLLGREPACSMDISDDSSAVDIMESSTATSDAILTLPASSSRVHFPRSTMFFTPPSSSSGIGSYLLGSSGDERAVPPASKSTRRRWWAENRTESAGVALLNVESFSLNEAAATLKQSYGELLLRSLDHDDQYVTMEDFIVMSCLISACEDIAVNLTRLNTLAAS